MSGSYDQSGHPSEKADPLLTRLGAFSTGDCEENGTVTTGGELQSQAIPSRVSSVQQTILLEACWLEAGDEDMKFDWTGSPKQTKTIIIIALVCLCLGHAEVVELMFNE